MSSDEVCFVTLQSLVVQSFSLQPENAQQVSGGLPVALLVDVAMQVIFGFLLGFATDNVDVNPDASLAPMRTRHRLEMGDLLLCAFKKGTVLEDDEVHVAVARGEVLRRWRPARVHDRRGRPFEGVVCG